MERGGFQKRELPAWELKVQVLCPDVYANCSFVLQLPPVRKAEAFKGSFWEKDKGWFAWVS